MVKKRKNSKKRGGNNDFIDKLMKDRAEALAFYFLINDIDNNNYLNAKFIEKLDLIYESYNLTKTQLNTVNNKKENIIYFRIIENYNKINNINYSNYGSEGHILKFLDLNSIEKITQYINEIKKNNNTTAIYTYDNYMKKIGNDIAIYEYFFDKKLEDVQKTYISKFIQYFIDGLKIDIYDFIAKVKNEISRCKTNNITLNFASKEKEPNIYLQQLYNIYKYPYETIDNTQIIYINTRKLTFEIPIEFNKKINFRKYLLANI
jgi:hypothetical protein